MSENAIPESNEIQSIARCLDLPDSTDIFTILRRIEHLTAIEAIANTLVVERASMDEVTETITLPLPVFMLLDNAILYGADFFEFELEAITQ